MVFNPISMRFENSRDLDLRVGVTEKSSPAVPNGVVSKKKSKKFESNSTVDENTADSLHDDLSIDSRIIGKIMEMRKEDSVRVKSTSFNPINRLCSETTSLEKSDNSTDNKTDSCGLQNHISNSSAKVNGFSAKRSSDDNSKDEVNFKELPKTKSFLKKFLGNGLLNGSWQSAREATDESSVGQKLVEEETEKSSTDLPVSCDKSNASNERRIHRDILESRDAGCTSSAPFKRKRVVHSDDSDSGSENISSCTEKRSKIAHSEGSSCSEKRSKAEDRVVPTGPSVCENATNSMATNSVRPRKKTTARKSTGGVVRQIITHLVEEEYAEEPPSDAENLVTPVENGVDHSTVDFVDVNASSNEERHPAEDRKYPIKFTRECMSDESLKNVFQKLKKCLRRRQLEEMMIQKCCEIISENSEIGELKKKSLEIEATEVFRKNKILSIEKQIHQLTVASKVFCNQACLAKEHDRITLPKVITRSVGLQVSVSSERNSHSERRPKVTTRSVGLQVSLSTTSETNSRSTGVNSVDVDDQRAPSAVTNSRITSSEAGQSSSCSSLTKSPRPSNSETMNKEKTQNPSLPTNSSSAASSRSNTVSSAKENSSSQTPAKVPPAASDDAIVDLTELDDNGNGLPISRPRHPSELPVPARHPAPLPPPLKNRNVLGAKLPPPKPNLSIQKSNLAIRMTWNLPLSADYEPIEKYQIYAYQETAGVPATVSLWKLVGDVESLTLPMACTLTQFVNGYTYHFAVRAVDKHGRHGPFSCAKSITL